MIFNSQAPGLTGMKAPPVEIQRAKANNDERQSGQAEGRNTNIASLLQQTLREKEMMPREGRPAVI